MSFTDQLVLKDEFGSIIGTFNLVAKDLALTSRVLADSTAAQPCHLHTRHQMGSGVKALDRHTVSLQETLLDSQNNPFQMTTSISWIIPRTELFGPPRVRRNTQLLMAYLSDSYQGPNISSANLSALLRGES